MAKSKSAIDMTARWLERLRPPVEGREEHFDKNVPGLGIRVSATGHMSWFVMYRMKGDPKVKRLTLEPYPQMTLADARERARKALLDAARGGDPAGKKRQEKEAPSFEELATEYLERYAKREKRSWKQDEAMIKKVLVPAWGRRKAHDVQRRDIIQLLDGARDRGLTTQVNRILALARKIYNWGIERDIVQSNPCTLVKTGISEKQRDRVLNPDEIRAVWKAFESLDLVMSAMFKLRLITAQRGAEVANMRWTDLDLATGWWTIPGEVAKNGLSHRVPLSKMALDQILMLKDKTGKEPWVFASPTRKGQHIASIGKAAGRMQDASGVDFVMHDLRRTAASYMTGMGINRLVVSKILNHVESGVTRVYDRHSYDAEKRQALDAWAQRLEEILSAASQQALDGAA
jgi:integrase